ncbi:MAG: hypothetical protein WCE75_03345, partial [Terracidiphilus sp.]
MLGTALRHTLESRGLPVVQLVRGAARAPGQAAWNPQAEVPLADTAPLEGAAAAIHLSGASIAEGRWTQKRRRELAES